MTDDIKKHQLRVLQYDLVDGTHELFFGLMFLLMAIYFVIQAAAPESFSNSILNFLLFILLIPAGAFLINLPIQKLKERVTYPRTGFIVPRRPPEPNRVTRWAVWIGVPVLVVVILALLAIYRPVINSPHAQDWLQTSPLFPVFSSILMCGLWVIIGWRIGLRRFFIIAVLTLLSGIGILLTGLGGNLGMALLFGAMGAVLCASGGVTLWRYLRQNPPPQDTPDEQ